jgi:hypothetical protein
LGKLPGGITDYNKRNIKIRTSARTIKRLQKGRKFSRRFFSREYIRAAYQQRMALE